MAAQSQPPDGTVFEEARQSCAETSRVTPAFACLQECTDTFDACAARCPQESWDACAPCASECGIAQNICTAAC